MDIAKSILAGCGLVAIFAMVGCIGVAGYGAHTVNQMRNDDGTHVLLERGSDSDRPARPARSTYESDPFEDYEPRSYDDDGHEMGGWGDDTE